MTMIPVEVDGLGRVLKNSTKELEELEIDEYSRPSKLQNCCEVSKRLEDTCCLSDSNEKPPAGLKTPQKVK